MDKVTDLQVKEALKEALTNQTITSTEYQAIMQSLQEGNVTPVEIYEGYLPFKQSSSRHR